MHERKLARRTIKLVSAAVTSNKTQLLNNTSSHFVSLLTTQRFAFSSPATFKRGAPPRHHDVTPRCVIAHAVLLLLFATPPPAGKIMHNIFWTVRFIKKKRLIRIDLNEKLINSILLCLLQIGVTKCIIFLLNLLQVLQHLTSIKCYTFAIYVTYNVFIWLTAALL